MCCVFGMRVQLPPNNLWPCSLNLADTNRNTDGVMPATTVIPRSNEGRKGGFAGVFQEAVATIVIS